MSSQGLLLAFFKARIEQSPVLEAYDQSTNVVSDALRPPFYGATVSARFKL